MRKRHQGLIPLTHDHHHALAQARLLRVAAHGDEADLVLQAKEFLHFFHDETIEHFRHEEEIVFPLGVGDERANALLSRVLMEHLRLHASVGLLGAEVNEGGVTQTTATEVAESLEKHIRLEESQLFPLLEEIVPEERLADIGSALRSEAGQS